MLYQMPVSEVYFQKNVPETRLMYWWAFSGIAKAKALQENFLEFSINT